MTSEQKTWLKINILCKGWWAKHKPVEPAAQEQMDAAEILYEAAAIMEAKAPHGPKHQECIYRLRLFADWLKSNEAAKKPFDGPMEKSAR